MITFSTRNAFDHWLTNKWKDEFGGDLHFSQGSSNICGVLMTYYGNQDIAVKKKSYLIKKGQIFVLDAQIHDTEKEQVSVLNELTTILLITIILYLLVTLTCFWHLFSTNGGTPILKSRFVNRLIELNETLDLCDIWRIKKP